MFYTGGDNMTPIRRLVWDDWNTAHIARHGVSPAEVEEVCENDPMISATYKERIRAVGLTRAGEMLTAILAPQGGGVYYPVTARPASRQERRRYRAERGEVR